MNRDKKIFRKRQGMTLIELLAAVAIVGALSSIVYAVSSSALNQAAAASESAAARQLVNAYLLSPMEFDGCLAKGSLAQDEQEQNDAVPLFNGRTASPGEPAADRWTWRVAQYMDSPEGLFTDSHQGIYQYLYSRDDYYRVSLTPSFGMNYIFVGGHYGGGNSSPAAKTYSGRGDRTGSPRYPADYCVTRLDVAYQPGNLIVFASSLSTFVPDGWKENDYAGYYHLEAPQNPSGANWGSYNEEIPASMGYVHLRHNNKAVVAHLDGSVALLNEEELKDMRRWSNQAAKFNDRNFSDWTKR